LVFNASRMCVKAAIDGLGLAFVMEDLALPYLADGRLRTVLEDWCEPFAGYHLYYPSRRQPTPAFAVFIEALRRHGRSKS
jgi:DNA-binding transcriptional LysR family regulator